MRKISIAIVMFVFSVASIAQAESEKSELTLHHIDNVATFCAGGLIAVESALLLFGMNYPHPGEWSTGKNLSFAITDVLLGSALLYYGISGRAYEHDWLYYTITSLLLLSHVYRDIEHLGAVNHSFTANAPLFILNNVRIGLLGLSIGLSMSLAL